MKLLRACIFLCAVIMAAGAVAAPAFAADQEQIDSFFTRVQVNPDSSIDVFESIKYSTGPIERHGILRDIRLRSASGNKLEISGILVTDENQQPIEFNASKSGDMMRLKIGDPDVTFSGTHTYHIGYKIQGAIGYFTDFDEIYWNMTGNEWSFPIMSAAAAVGLPEGASIQKAACYYGAEGSTAQCNASTTQYFSQLGALSFAAPGMLNPGEGLTVAVGFDKGIVREPTLGEKIWGFIKSNGILALPILVFISMFMVWHKKGRDPEGRGTIVAEYDVPDNLSPLEISSVMSNGNPKSKDISAQIIQLATKGHIKITRVEEKVLFIPKTDYVLTRLKRAEGLASIDAEIMGALFGAHSEIKVSDLKNKFYLAIPGIHKKALNSVLDKGYFAGDPNKARGKYIIAGIVVVFGAFWAGSVLAEFGGLATVIAAILSGVIIFIFGMLMPKVTPEGAVLKERVLGLKEYLDIAEKDRIAFHNAPEKKPELFEKLLPYAMVLGVEEAWAKEFEGIYMTPPSWYNDPSGRAFSSVILAHNLSSFSSAASSALTSSPRGSGSGGGGFSGGGGGGGGGGSW